MNTQGERAEAISLLGTPLFGPVAAEPGEIGKLQQALSDAEEQYQADPDACGKLAAYAQALAGVWRFRDSIEVYNRGLEKWPGEAMLYCDRGHRFISIRQFAKAQADLAHAAQLKDDSWDIYYHLGIAHWMLADFEGAERAFGICYDLTPDESHQVAVTDWLYMSRRRLGRVASAEPLLADIHPEMKTTGNNHCYLYRLLFYKGELSEPELVERSKRKGLAPSTVGFGLGCWHLYSGSPGRARQIFGEIVQGKYWPAFGFLGAEAELSRMQAQV